MKTNRLRSLWIGAYSLGVTVHTCLKTCFMYLLGKNSRSWVDEEIQRWVNRMLKKAKITVKIINPHDIKPEKGEATIIMCNHTSLYDIPISFCVFKKNSMRMLAKKELSKIPLFGLGMRATEFAFVDRKNRNQALQDLEYAKKLMESGILLWIAPEGTRSLSGKLNAFKKGGFITAIQAKATIIPIGIRGAFDILPAKTTQYRLNQTAEVHVGDPIHAGEYTLENKDVLIERVHKEMKRLVGEE